MYNIYEIILPRAFMYSSNFSLELSLYFLFRKASMVTNRKIKRDRSYYCPLIIAQVYRFVTRKRRRRTDVRIQKTSTKLLYALSPSSYGHRQCGLERVFQPENLMR